MKTNGNDPSNPIPMDKALSFTDNPEYGLGLTKREQFAMAAMVGFINTGCVRAERNGVVNNQYNYVSIAKSAVDQADALITVLNEEVPNG